MERRGGPGETRHGHDRPASGRASARRGAAQRTGARRLCDRWRHVPAASGERIRLAGIDAPETRRGQAKCRREIAAGRAATATARTLLLGRTVRFARLGRSYNRTVARVTLDGRDVAGGLVRLGVARWWPRGARKPDWCAAKR